MQFLRLIFVKKLQGALPPGPPLEAAEGAQAPTFQLTFPFLIPMPVFNWYNYREEEFTHVFMCVGNTILTNIMFTPFLWKREREGGEKRRQSCIDVSSDMRPDKF